MSQLHVLAQTLLTVLTILENVFTDVNFREQYIHVSHVHMSKKYSIQYDLSYKDSCELCGDVILITAALCHYKM